MASSLLISVLIAGILIVLKCGVSSANATATGESKSNTASLLYQIIGDLSVIKHENNELAEKIEMLEGQFDPELEAELNGKLESGLESLQSEIEEKLESRLETMETAIETNRQSGIESLRTEVEGKLDSRLASLESALEGKLESGLASLESALETKRQSGIQSLRTEVEGTLESRLKLLESKLDTKRLSGLEDLRSEVDGKIGSKLETFGSALEEKLETGIESLESKLDVQRESLRTEVGNIGSEVKSLQSELEILKDQTPQPTWCSPPYTYNAELRLCWRLETETELSWSGARSTCISEGGDLIILDTPQKVAYIQKSVAGMSIPDPHIWVGADDLSEEGKFKWLNGAPVLGIPWNSGEPNNLGGHEDCLEMYESHGKFNDDTCTSIRSFLCELS